MPDADMLPFTLCVHMLAKVRHEACFTFAVLVLPGDAGTV
jgi:hypothetical protein